MATTTATTAAKNREFESPIVHPFYVLFFFPFEQLGKARKKKEEAEREGEQREYSKLVTYNFYFYRGTKISSKKYNIK